MRRRHFLNALGTTILAGTSFQRISGNPGNVHIVTLSFDDGFKKSFKKIAEIYEMFGLSACFNVIASAHMNGNDVRDEYYSRELVGDFRLWNELQDRGHEIMPHGYKHAHLADLALKESTAIIMKCLEIFHKELRGFDPKKSVFNFPYNQSSRELEDWLLSEVMAYRTSGGAINPLPGSNTRKVTTGSFGPGNAEEDVEKTLEQLLNLPSGWMVYNLHGLDEEGWGPISPGYLEKLLLKLTKIESVRVVPTARALLQAKKLS